MFIKVVVARHRVALATLLAQSNPKPVEVYSDAVPIALADGKAAVAVFMVDDELRVEVRIRGPEGARGPAGRVYPGQFACPHLPAYARRR
jgi:hypothetical protein